MAEVQQNMTTAEAQREHKALQDAGPTKRSHSGDWWRYCPACRRRLRRAKVLVDGKPV